MSLRPELDGDVTLIEGTMLASVLSAKDKAFVGFYALTPTEGTYIRGARTWITATGASLNKLNGAQLVGMEKSFIDTFDRLDVSGSIPTFEQIKAESVTGKLGSWDSQPSLKALIKK